MQFSARGEVGEGSRDIARDHLVVLPAEVREQLLVAREVLGSRSGHAFGRADVQAEQFPVRALRHACGPANQCLGSGRAGDRDEDAFSRLPRLGDPVPLAVLAQRFVDTVRDPQQRQLPQRGEVSRPEVVRE